MFVLKGLLRAESQEQILLYLLTRKEGYAKAIADFYQVAPNQIQKQLLRLEEDSVIVSKTLGRTRIFELNPRYAFIIPLKALLKKALETYPGSIRSDLIMNRGRPRKSGKPVEYVESSE